MGSTSFGDLHCSLSRTLDLVGDRWTLLVVRDLALGISRFDAIARNLRVSRKVLTQRLQTLAEQGLVERTAYQDNPLRYDYRLTDKGNDLSLVLLAMQTFGDKWSFAEEGPPLQWRHLLCGELASPVQCCDQCGEPLRPGEALPLRGPSFDEHAAPEVSALLTALHGPVDSPDAVTGAAPH